MHQSNSPIPSQSDNNNNIAPPPPISIAPPPISIAPPPAPPHFGTFAIRGFICLVVIKFIIFLLILYWIIFTSITFFAEVESRIVGASLTRFDLNTNNNTLLLDYNLTVDIDVKNPNRLVNVNYDKIEVRAFYQGNRFDSVNLIPFYQGHHHKKNKTTSVHPVFQGQALLAIPISWDNSQYSKLIHGYNGDKSDGMRFDIQVELHFKVTYELRRFQQFDCESKPMCKCDLKRIPLITTMHSNSSSSNDHVGDQFWLINTKCALEAHSHN